MEMNDLTGDWDVRLKFLLGEARHSARLEQEGDALKGWYRSQFGEQEVRGRVCGNEVEMQVGIRYQHCGANYGFRGEIDGDAIRGQVDLGEYWSAEWEARKVG